MPGLREFSSPSPPPISAQKATTPDFIPKDWDGADEADKMLFTFRDKNVHWTEIRAKRKHI